MIKEYVSDFKRDCTMSNDATCIWTPITTSEMSILKV